MAKNITIFVIKTNKKSLRPVDTMNWPNWEPPTWQVGSGDTAYATSMYLNMAKSWCRVLLGSGHPHSRLGIFGREGGKFYFQRKQAPVGTKMRPSEFFGGDGTDDFADGNDLSPISDFIWFPIILDHLKRVLQVLKEWTKRRTVWRTVRRTDGRIKEKMMIHFGPKIKVSNIIFCKTMKIYWTWILSGPLSLEFEQVNHDGDLLYRTGDIGVLNKFLIDFGGKEG